MEKLFIENNFKHKYIKYIGPYKNYFLISPFYYFINKFIQRKSSQKPFICPVCGFSNNKKNKTQISTNIKKKRSILINFLNILWPQKINYRWIIALYKKTN